MVSVCIYSSDRKKLGEPCYWTGRPMNGLTCQHRQLTFCCRAVFNSATK